MIEQSGSDAVRHPGLAVKTEMNDAEDKQTADSEQVGNQSLERLTEDRNNAYQKKPRRFSYQSGSTILDGYTIKRGIGIGGFGEVYFGISDAGKEVALKRIQRNLDVELRGVSQCLNLKHINLIALWDIRQDTEGESWVVMEYVPGESLRDVLEQNPEGVSIEESRKWFTQILDGVAYLHDHGIVHRDLKPGNIFYDQDEKVVKIGDYGLSKFISTSKRDGQTESVGTFHYMAPEIGKGSYGKEIDIYSLGIILCEVLSGRVPFDGESGQEIIMKHLTETPKIDFVNARFHSVIHRALSKDPNQRFESVQQMMASIDWEGTGRIVVPTTDPASNPQTGASSDGGSPPNSIVEPMFIREEEALDKVDDGNRQAKFEPMYIGDDEIQLGELRNSSGGVPTSGPLDPQDTSNWSVSEDGSMKMSEIKAPERPVVSDQVGLAAQGAVVSSTKTSSTEPIASAFGTGYEKVSQWWKGLGATPIKVGLVVILALFVLFNAQWLVPLSIALGCVYMVYYLVRTNVSQREKNPNHNATTIRPFSRKECLRMIEEKLRETRLSLPFAEKLAESLGSILTATLVAGISTLVALGFSGFDLDGSVATLSIFTWLTLTAVFGSAACIFVTKTTESSIGNQWKRRFVMMTIGMVIGALSYGVYHSFLIDSVVFPDRISSLENLQWMTEGETGAMRFITFFAGLFLVIRWWRVGDALRTSQFSVFMLVLHAILAVGLAVLTSFPVVWGLIIGGTLSIAVQLSSTWIKTSEREKIQYEVMQSISA